ncbi:hypothetical protein [Vreelandella maris]|jgi:hypothetical protein|uniref:hypothetical protein n=1 Tax=Vreelandella maris TaxID=2729617 RepID=UPI001592E15F|nr:hypothetical protein [Halomonas maris]|tara:strand:- start:408 stop:563 length:156 start_codon:yes stop_codon:yes gene_type:complete
MKYQDHFPTIWDAPRKTSAKPANQAPAKKVLSPVKEAFLSIWDIPKRQPSA